jgi:hypothetical protein
VRDPFVIRWQGRLGKRAAQQLFRALMGLMVGSAIGLVFLVVSFATGFKYSAIGVVALVAFLVAIVVFWSSLLAASRSLSHFYGKRIRIFGLPPLKDERFETWCRKNDVVVPSRRE